MTNQESLTHVIEETPFFPVFIPSRGRSHNVKGTAALLSAAGISFTLIVEPHEVEAYRQLLTTLNACGTVVSLPKSHQGISYARNFILDLAPADGWFWVMDDDIQGFFRAINRINSSIGPRELHSEVLQRMQKHPNATVYSIDYPFYAWQYGDEAVAINSYNNIAVLFNRARLDQSIRYRFQIREDYDFTLQVILAGGTTIRFRNLSYKVPRMAVAAGGMTDYYSNKKDDIVLQNKAFLKIWPSVSREVVKGTGDQQRLDMNIKWLLLHPLRCKDPVEVLRSQQCLNIAPQNTTEEKGKPPRKRERKTPEGSSDDEVDIVVPQHRLEPRKQQVLQEKHLPGWKGYAIETYRAVTEDIAKSVGLERIADRLVKVGHVVIVTPWALHLPAAVTARILEVSRNSHPKKWSWTAVIETIKSAPLQTVSDCYQLAPADEDTPSLSFEARLEIISETLDAIVVNNRDDEEMRATEIP